MGSSLHEEITRFKAWAADDAPVEGRGGEWECNYPFWHPLNESFMAHLDASTPQTSDVQDFLDILYAVGRENETEAFINELTRRTAWFPFLLPHALASDDADVRWQFAKQLGNGKIAFNTAESALLQFVADENEYVSRMALRSLGQIGSRHTERLCASAWASDHEYQRIMALWVLKDIKSPQLTKYLRYATEDGRHFVVSNAAEIARALNEAS